MSAELTKKVTKGAIDVAPRMRQAFMHGLNEHCKRQNKSLNDVVADWWEEDWKSAGQLLTRFMPREIAIDAKVEHEHRHRVLAVQRLDEFLTGVTEQGRTNAANEGTSKERPVLPAPIPIKQT